MAQSPSIETRKRRRVALMTTDPAMRQTVESLAPAGWEVVCETDLAAFGEWHEVLLFRFMVLDLDEIEAFDPLDVIHVVRREYQINLPVFCFGGDDALQDEMRLARADRFFAKDALAEALPGFFAAYDWS